MAKSTKLRQTFITLNLAGATLAGCDAINKGLDPTPIPATSGATQTTTAVAPTPVPAPVTAPGADTSTLMSRIVINPPGFNHPAVSEATIQAVKNAINALPPEQRKKLDQNGARVIVSPNMIDRWPESVKDLPEAEKSPLPTLAEQPGRIYGVDMCVYERPKKRGTTDLGEARQPAYIQLQVGDMCFQVLDGDAMVLSKDPELRKEYDADKKAIAPIDQAKVAEFTKPDDWGPRETCAELFGSMMGGRNENTDNLFKNFPRVKKWLITKLGITGQG